MITYLLFFLMGTIIILLWISLVRANRQNKFAKFLYVDTCERMHQYSEELNHLKNDLKYLACGFDRLKIFLEEAANCGVVKDSELFYCMEQRIKSYQESVKNIF